MSKAEIYNPSSL